MRISTVLLFIIAAAAQVGASGAAGTRTAGTQAFSPDTLQSGEPDPRYYRYDTILETFTGWEAAYPEIFHREIIGYTLAGGEPIWAARISDHPAEREEEPSLLFHAAQHANEPNGTTAILHTMTRLLEGYGPDSLITRMVNSLEIWFVPVVNVDGHRLVFEGEFNRAWRKTARDNDADGSITYPVDGVDPNRNWDWRWAEYDSVDYGSESYKGPYPFSEPEVVAIRDFILRERPVFIMDYHSPVHSDLGNYVWWPWFRVGSQEYSPDAPFYGPICTELGRRTLTENDTVFYNGSVAGLDILPKEQNWVYANTGACILLMEISMNNLWTGAMVDTIGARVGRGSLYLLERAIEGPGLTGRVRDQDTGLPITAEIRVTRAHDDSVGPRLTEGRFGRYWRLLNPGMYDVRVLGPGYYPVVRQVVVASEGWSEQDFWLEINPAAGLEPAPPEFSAEAVAPPRLLWRNPLRPGQTVRLELAESADVSLDLLDVSGRRLRRLLEGRLTGGIHGVPAAFDLPGGVYLFRLQAGDRILTRKVVVTR